jgi:hypothetical protein
LAAAVDANIKHTTACATADCCGLKDTALCIGTHSPDTAAGELLLLYKSGQLVRESSEALMFVNGSSEKLLAGENLRLQEGLYMLPAGTSKLALFFLQQVWLCVLLACCAQPL